MRVAGERSLARRETSAFMWHLTRVGDQLLRRGLSSPATQPTASVRIGSTARASVSMWSQVEHSNVRRWNPYVPAVMRFTFNGCLHFGHCGRSIVASLLNVSNQFEV